MAAGLTIKRDVLYTLMDRLNAADGLTEDQLVEKVYLDVPMPVSYVTLDLAVQLEQLEPFGNGNPKPMFAERGLAVRNIRRMGKDGATLRLQLENKDGNRSEVIAFQGEELFQDIKIWSGEKECDTIKDIVKIDLMYQVSVNEFRGERKPECRLVYYRKSTEE